MNNRIIANFLSLVESNRGTTPFRKKKLFLHNGDDKDFDDEDILELSWDKALMKMNGDDKDKMIDFFFFIFRHHITSEFHSKQRYKMPAAKLQRW